MVMDRRFSNNGHQVRLSIEHTTNGWYVREELDAETVHLKHFNDWHRAERAVDVLEFESLRPSSIESASSFIPGLDCGSAISRTGHSNVGGLYELADARH